MAETRPASTSGITRALAAWTLGTRADELPAAVMHQASRAFINHVACALSGRDEPASAHAFTLADAFSGERRATVFGRVQGLDAAGAALVNGTQSSIQTFDDTHLASVVHPTGPVAGALLALAQHRPSPGLAGADFLAALALGIELSCRVGAVLTAEGSGLHLGVFTTSVAGGVGAAAACGRLLGLDEQRQAWAMGIAVSQAGGSRVAHATMTGGLLAGIAARAGLEAALLAGRGLDASEAALEARNGLLDLFAPQARAQDLLAALGEHYELADLAYKPYPCGIVIHPSIDACLDLVPALAGETIAHASLRVHPLALRLTGLRHPARPLDCKISLYHWVAAALLRGQAGLEEEAQAVWTDAAISALRERIEAQADDTLARDEAHLHLRLASGRELRAHVPHARGSLARPMTDAELDRKFLALATPVLREASAGELRALLRALPGLDARWLQNLAGLAVPG